MQDILLYYYYYYYYLFMIKVMNQNGNLVNCFFLVSTQHCWFNNCTETKTDCTVTIHTTDYSYTHTTTLIYPYNTTTILQYPYYYNTTMTTHNQHQLNKLLHSTHALSMSIHRLDHELCQLEQQMRPLHQGTMGAFQ